jgi:hypothetical protein
MSHITPVGLQRHNRRLEGRRDYSVYRLFQRAFTELIRNLKESPMPAGRMVSVVTPVAAENAAD